MKRSDITPFTFAADRKGNQVWAVIFDPPAAPPAPSNAIPPGGYASVIATLRRAGGAVPFDVGCDDFSKVDRGTSQTTFVDNRRVYHGSSALGLSSTAVAAVEAAVAAMAATSEIAAVAAAKISIVAGVETSVPCLESAVAGATCVSAVMVVRPVARARMSVTASLSIAAPQPGHPPVVARLRPPPRRRTSEAVRHDAERDDDRREEKKTDGNVHG